MSEKQDKWANTRDCIRPIKKISVFRVKGQTHFLFNYFFFLEKNIILYILKGISPFKMHKILFFPENLKKILGFTSKFR